MTSSGLRTTAALAAMDAHELSLTAASRAATSVDMEASVVVASIAMASVALDRSSLASERGATGSLHAAATHAHTETTDSVQIRMERSALIVSPRYHRCEARC